MGRRPKSADDVARGQRLADVLREAREAGPLSQEQLAVRASVSVETVRSVERNRIHNPSFFTVVRLAQALRVGLDQLASKAMGSQP
jgi:transcriptional regulator with XRE-family HTH domain